MSKTLAKLILDAAELHETSFDHVAADNAYYGGGVLEDDEKFYQISKAAAAKQVAAEMGCIELEHPAYLLLKYTWNDAINWAMEIKNPTMIPLNSIEWVNLCDPAVVC